MVFPGLNRKKRSSIGGDFDGDGVKNRKDCEPLNFRRQGAGHLKEYESICVDCDKKINDDTETKWSQDAEPYCKNCYNKMIRRGER